MSTPEPPPAVVWLQRGQQAEATGTAAGLAEALNHYDQAIAAISEAEASPVRLRGLIRMNRANVLMRLRRPADALVDYDEALACFGPLDPLSPPEARASIGGAWLNRAGALRASKPDDHAGALDSIEHAVAALRTIPIDAHPVYRRNLAAALVHRGDCLLRSQPAQPAAAAENAREGTELIAPIEDRDPASADVGLKARLVLLGALGARGNPGESTDLAESGIALARRWVERGIIGFGQPALRLMEIAGALYQLHQPHFLAEYWRENLVPVAPAPAWAPENVLREAALRTLRPAWHALQEQRLRDPAALNDRATAALSEIESLVRELEGSGQRSSASQEAREQEPPTGAP